MFKFSEIVTNLYLRCTLAGLSVDESSEIFNLNIDCFEELFEWLTIADLLTLRLTSRHMKHVVDYFIKKNYPTIRIGYKKIEIFSEDFIEINRLDPITIKAIKEIFFWTVKLTLEQIEIVKEILPQIERLYIAWQMTDKFYETFLQHCSNLKFLSLTIKHSTNDDGIENDWLSHNYPMLEHMVVNDGDVGEPGFGWQVPQLKSFFQLNQNVRIFSTTFHFLHENRQYFLDSDIKLDRIEVNGRGHNLEPTCDLLNKLHEQGIFQRLHLYVMLFTQQHLRQISSLNGLEKLYLANRFLDDADQIILPLLNFKEFALNYGKNSDHLDTVAQNLMEIERIYLGQATSNAILPFIRYSRNVNVIKVDELTDGSHFDKNVIDLVALNRYRNELAGACKVTIFVKENIFIETKRTNSNTNHNLVELRRSEAYHWEHLRF